jgi:hypothetical protein
MTMEDLQSLDLDIPYPYKNSKNKIKNKTRDESLGFFVYLCDMKLQKKFIPLYFWICYFIGVILLSLFLQHN